MSDPDLQAIHLKMLVDKGHHFYTDKSLFDKWINDTVTYTRAQEISENP